MTSAPEALPIAVGERVIIDRPGSDYHGAVGVVSFITRAGLLDVVFDRAHEMRGRRFKADSVVIPREFVRRFAA